MMSKYFRYLVSLVVIAESFNFKPPEPFSFASGYLYVQSRETEIMLKDGTRHVADVVGGRNMFQNFYSGHSI